MKRYNFLYLVLAFQVVSMPSYSAPSEQDRVETLENGDQVVVPRGMRIIPGQPLVLTDENMKQVASAKQELEKYGFVDRPDDLPIASRTMQFMRSEFQKKQNGNDKAADVHEAAHFDFSSVAVGKVNPAILRPESEAYVLVGSNEIRRTYSNTKYGDIHIHDMTGATMGVIGNSGVPNVEVAGYQGYRTTVRYAEGRMATLILLPNENGVMLVEFGDSFDGPNTDIDLQDFLTTLVVAREE